MQTEILMDPRRAVCCHAVYERANDKTDAILHLRGTKHKVTYPRQGFSISAFMSYDDIATFKSPFCSL